MEELRLKLKCSRHLNSYLYLNFYLRLMLCDTLMMPSVNDARIFLPQLPMNDERKNDDDMAASQPGLGVGEEIKNFALPAGIFAFASAGGRKRKKSW